MSGSTSRSQLNVLTRIAAKLLSLPAALILVEEGTSLVVGSQAGSPALLARVHELLTTTDMQCAIRGLSSKPESTDAGLHRFAASTSILPPSFGTHVVMALSRGDSVAGAFCAIRGGDREWTRQELDTLSTLAESTEYEHECNAECVPDHCLSTRPDFAFSTVIDERRELEQSNQMLQELTTELEAQAEELQATSLELEERASELEDGARRARFAGEIGQAIVSDSRLPAAMQRCCQAAVDHLRAAFARVWLVNEEEQVLTLVASAGCYTHLNGPHGRVPIGQFKIGQIASSKRPHLTNTVIGDPRVPSQEWAKQERMIAFAGYPLMVADAVVGVMAMFSRETLADEDFAALGIAATAISVAVSNSRNYDAGRQAREAAELANRGKAEFLTVMSHELRTPLNAIGGYAELLEMGLHGPVTSAQVTALQRIQRSQRHLLGLINGILNFAKVDAGMIEYELALVSLDEIRATCEALVTPQARAKNIALELGGGETGLWVYADRDKTQQILLNLLSNAVKFTEAGGKVSMVCTSNEKGDAIVHVSDTGRGIALEEIERVFQPFVQVDASLTRTEEGTGLGLAISRDLARAMHGDLRVESQVGVGSTFSLILPMTERPPAASDAFPT